MDIDFLAAAIITGCEFKCSVGDNGKTKTKEITSEESSGLLRGAIIKNDIMLDAKNVKVKGSYLTTNTGTPLNNNNQIDMGDKVNCVTLLDTGWTKYNGRSYLGASEKVLTEDGIVLLDIADLFKDYDESGVSAKDGEIIAIIANITEKVPGVDNYKVQFRIWDKRGNGEVTGSFKFKVN